MAKKQTGKRKKVSSGDTRGEHPYLLPDFYDKNPDLRKLAEKIAAK